MTDPAYVYLFPDARSPFDRAAGNGMRAIKRLDPAARGVENDPLPRRMSIDGRTLQPVTDAEYAVFTRFYDHRRMPLDARVEATDESSPHWIKHRVSFAAGYGTERTMALLYLPRNARPPYQSVLFMGGAATFYRKSSATEKDVFGWSYVEYLIRGGRAVMIPIWKGSYERSDGFHPLQTEWPSYREHVIQWVSELRQSVDYLQSRDDMADEAIAYEGVSNGAIWAPDLHGPRAAPQDRRPHFRRSADDPTPQHTDAAGNRRVQLRAARHAAGADNGRHDAIFPWETAQVPLYRLFGAAPADKTHLVFPGGHSSFGWMDELIKEALDWLDRRFGPVAR